jgi:hypothetical protein
MTKIDQNLDCIAPILVVIIVVGSVVLLFSSPQQTDSFIKENFAKIFYISITIATISNLVTLLLFTIQLPKAVLAIKFFVNYVKSKGWRTKTTFRMQYEKSNTIIVCEQIFPVLFFFSNVFLIALGFLNIEKTKSLLDAIMPVSAHLQSLVTVLVAEFCLIAGLFLVLKVFSSGILYDIWNDCYGYAVNRRRLTR